MEEFIFNEQWEKDAPSRKESLQYMKEHPLSYEQAMEQVQRNREIRKKNMKEMQNKAKNKKE